MQALVIRITHDVYVLAFTVNFMLKKNKRKSKKADPTGGAISAPPDPLAVTYPPPNVNIFRPPLSQNPGSAPGIIAFDFISKRVSSDVFEHMLLHHTRPRTRPRILSYTPIFAAESWPTLNCLFDGICLQFV